MKRSIRPFAVEIRGGRRGGPSWPVLSEPAPVHLKLRLPGPRPAPTPQQDEASAPPAWANARILPDLTPLRPADDEQQHDTSAGVEEQQEEARAAEDDAPVPRESEGNAVATAVQDCAKPVERRVKRLKDEAPNINLGPSEASTAMGAKVIARARKVLAPASESTERPGRGRSDTGSAGKLVSRLCWPSSLSNDAGSQHLPLDSAAGHTG